MTTAKERFATMHGAGAFEPNQLTGPQAKAYEDAIAILGDLAKRADERDRARKSSKGDERTVDEIAQRFEGARPSQVILFDAGRGAGKSSLLFTLCNESTRAFRAAAAGATENDVRKELSHYVPLQLLDVQPLPKGKPLLAYLLLALNALRQKIGGSADIEDEAAWLPSARGDALRRLDAAWNKLCLSVNAFDQGTDGHGDALVAAKMALEQAEAAGTLNRRFESFVDALVAGLKRHLNLSFAPMLLVPIDDADMNAELTHQCIEMLRMLFHPQVVFAITGHSELFLARLQQQGYRAFDGLDDAAKQLLTRRWAFELYDRVIPPARRCAIEELDPRDRILGSVQHLGVGESLASVMRWPSPDATLMSGINPHLFVERAGDETTAKTLPTTAALPDRLRALLNLRERLSELREEFRSEAARTATANDRRQLEARYAVEQAAMIWDDAIAFRFTNAEEAVIRNIFRSSGIDALPQLDLRAVQWNTTHSPVGHIGDRRNSTLSLWVSRVDGAAIKVGSEGRTPLDPRQYAALQLLINAVEEHFPNSAQAREMPFVDARPRFALAQVSDREGKKLSVPWPIPDWQSPAPFQQFAAYWATLVRAGAFDVYDEDDEHIAVKHMVRWYFALVVLVSLPWQLRYEGPWQQQGAWPRLVPLESWQMKFDEADEHKRREALSSPPTLDELAAVALWIGMSQPEHVEAHSGVIAAFDWLRSRAPMILAIEGGIEPRAVDELVTELRNYVDGLAPEALTALSSVLHREPAARASETADEPPAPSDTLLRLLAREAPKVRLFRRQWLAENGLRPEQLADDGHPWRLLFEPAQEFNTRRAMSELSRVPVKAPPSVPYVKTIGWFIDDSPAVLNDLPAGARAELLALLRDANESDLDNETTIARLGDVVAIAAREARVPEQDAKEPALEINGSKLSTSIPRFSYRKTTSARSPRTLSDGARVFKLESFIPIEQGRLRSLDFLACLYGDLVAHVLGRDPHRGSSWLPKVIAWPGLRRALDEKGELEARFPAPRVPSPGEKHDLLALWNEFISELDSTSLCARSWCATIAESVLRPAIYPEFVSDAPTWTALFELWFKGDVDLALRDDRTPRIAAMRYFRGALPLFAAPERGLPIDEVREILDATKARKLSYSPELAALRKTLTRYSDDVKRARPDNIFDKIDSAKTETSAAWRSFIESATRSVFGSASGARAVSSSRSKNTKR